LFEFFQLGENGFCISLLLSGNRSRIGFLLFLGLCLSTRNQLGESVNSFEDNLLSANLSKAAKVVVEALKQALKSFFVGF
jgi:hypothetical protein